MIPESTPLFVASMAMNGSDLRTEHIFGAAADTAHVNLGWSGATILTESYAMESKACLNADGQYDAYLTVVDPKGEYTLFAGEQESSAAHLSLWRLKSNLFGDEVFSSNLLDPNGVKAFMLVDRELTSIELGDLPYYGGYLSGDKIRIFRPGDGYYAVDLTTREEVKLADSQLPNSQAYIVQPNCILEATMFGRKSLSVRSEIDSHSLRFFNGERWWDIELPDELKNLDENSFVEFMALTSDRIMLILSKGSGTNLQLYSYQILLGTDEPVLESLGCLQLYIDTDA